MQKVVKKLKDLGKKGHNTQTVEEYEAELTCLKGVDHDSIGNTALKTKLLKDRTLRENEGIMTAMNKELEEGSLVVVAEPGTTVAKIQSRLLSSKFLSIQVATSLEALKVLLNPALKQNELENNIARVSLDKGIERPSKLSILNSTDKEPSRLDNSNIDMDGWESGSINDDGFEEPDDVWESDDTGPNDTQDDEHQESESKDKETNAKTKSKPSKQEKAVKSFSSKNESIFLPSLSVGFIRGGSDDSDWSETEGKDTDLEPKKNRRGQRARRAIWEKKFGRNANHKKKEEETRALARTIRGHTSQITGSKTSKTQQGSSATKGSLRQSKDKSFSQVHNPAYGSSALVTPASTLHPSWEAKRRLKEKQSIGIVTSQGKKIKFS